MQEFGLRRTAELLVGRAPRIHWYSLYDLPQAWPATTRHKEAEGSSYYRHFSMGLLREDGTPKRAARRFAEFAPDLGICQWFHFEDHRLDEAVHWLKRLGVRHLRTGLSWADSFRPNAEAWFDRQMRALEPFDVTLTFCFTPEHRGLAPHHTSPPLSDDEFAEFCLRMIRRYCGAGAGGRRTRRSRQARDHDAGRSPIDAARALLAELAGHGPILARMLVVVAHPDDETIGLGAQLCRLRDALLLHVTDGAPRDGEDARRHGFAALADYAAARRRELAAALIAGDASGVRRAAVGIPDKDAFLDLAGLSRGSRPWLRRERPTVVLTHAYEGGHPDHDAAAFAVHAACRCLGAEARPAIVEFPSYHAQRRADGRRQVSVGSKRGGHGPAGRGGASAKASDGRLLPHPARDALPLRSDPERFRPAPAYDFRAPPHSGVLLYETFGWGISGVEWRRRASEALGALGLD